MEREIINHYLGQIVRVDYRKKGVPISITGIIRSVHNTIMVFDVNDTGKEITIPNINVERIKFV